MTATATYTKKLTVPLEAGPRRKRRGEEAARGRRARLRLEYQDIRLMLTGQLQRFRLRRRRSDDVGSHHPREPSRSPRTIEADGPEQRLRRGRHADRSARIRNPHSTRSELGSSGRTDSSRDAARRRARTTRCNTTHPQRTARARRPGPTVPKLLARKSRAPVWNVSACRRPAGGSPRCRRNRRRCGRHRGGAHLRTCYAPAGPLTGFEAHASAAADKAIELRLRRRART